MHRENVNAFLEPGRNDRKENNRKTRVKNGEDNKSPVPSVWVVEQ